MTDTAIAGLGHNGGPPLPYDPDVFAECTRDTQEFTLAAGQWKDLGEIETADQSQKATDFVSGARKVYKRIDDARKAAKQPHDDAGKAVQAAFAPLLDKITRSVDAVKAMQAKWLKAEQARAEAKKRAEAEDAARQRAEAERQRAEAEARNDISGLVDAEQALKDAEKAEKAAERPAEVKATSATGGGRTMSLRKNYRCHLTAPNRAFAHFRDHPEVQALLVRLADAEVRAQKGEKAAPPGFELEIQEVAA